MFSSIVHLSLLASLAASILPSAYAQTSYDQDHNVTSLLGTWSSGSGNVKTGAGFANPLNFSFEYPKTTGISYSFTVGQTPDGSDGYFEEAQYRFEGNATRPSCITGVVIFQHGSYVLNSNGTITLNPIPSDGRIQVQDMCAAQSNIIQQFNQTTLFGAWRIFQDAQRGAKLQLYRWDGAPLSPMYLLSETPDMLPVESLTPNVTTGARSIVYASSGKSAVVGLGMEDLFTVSILAVVSGVWVLL